MIQQIDTSQFRKGVYLSLVTATLLLFFSLILGKTGFFLLLNHPLGSIADLFFRYWTHLGDGSIWVMVAILFFIYRRKLLPLLIAAIVISTLIAQLSKHVFFADAPRPIKVIAAISQVHTVQGVNVHTLNSFPSGHTTTTFSIFLLACLLIRWKWIVPVGFLCALLAGYSRIYLAQHFPLDVAAGMLAAVVAVLVSLQVQKRWSRQTAQQSKA